MPGDSFVTLTKGSLTAEQPVRQIRIAARMATDLFEKLVDNIIDSRFGNLIHWLAAAA